MTLRVSLPRWFLPIELGLGEVVKRGSAAVGVKPCASCHERAQRLNQMLILAPAEDRALRASPGLALLPAGGTAPVQGAVAAGRPAATDAPPVNRQVEHLPDDEGTPESSSDKCCTFSVTLTNRRWPRPSSWPAWLWPVPQATKIRVTATAGTTIEAADPDGWNQVANFPNSVTWDPGTGGAIPLGDPTDSWIIDKDILLSLGPVSSGVKTITIEWLAASGLVLDAFQVSIPCALGDEEPDLETDWQTYTTVVSGGRCVFAYLEPDDCDAGDFDRALCIITPPTAVCHPGSFPNNTYDVTFATATSGSTYQWSINSIIQPNTTSTLQATLAPGSYIIGLSVTNSAGTVTHECSRQLDLLRPLPDFSIALNGCTSIATLDASQETENYNLVTHCDWECSDLTVPIQSAGSTGNPATANFSGFPEGWYDIILSVTDQYGCIWKEKHPLYVGGCEGTWEPNYSWCVEKIDPTIHKDVEVTFTGTPGGCGPYNPWTWDFGDSSSSTDVNPSHIYQNAFHGQQYYVTLTYVDTNGCNATVGKWITITQREMPKFTVKVCPDGKVICETGEPHPKWNSTDWHQIAPWPFTKPKKHRSRIIYRYLIPGTKTVTLTSTNDYGNECEASKTFDVLLDCCAKNAHTRKKSDPISVVVNGNPATLRVKAKLWQIQAPFWHRVKARTILQKRNSNGNWQRHKSRYVELVASFGPTGDWPAASGIVYMSEQGALAFDGFHFTGCNCYVPVDTSKEKRLSNKRKVRAVDAIGDRFRSKLNSIESHHGVTIGGTSYPMANLSLGEESDCGETWNWWTNWF